MRFKVGRFLVRHKNDKKNKIEEINIVEVSSSGNYIKIGIPSNAFWESVEDFIIVEALDKVKPSTSTKKLSWDDYDLWREQYSLRELREYYKPLTIKK